MVVVGGVAAVVAAVEGVRMGVVVAARLEQRRKRRREEQLPVTNAMQFASLRFRLRVLPTNTNYLLCVNVCVRVRVRAVRVVRIVRVHFCVRAFVK